MKKRTIALGILLLAGMIFNSVTGCGATAAGEDNIAIVVDDDDSDARDNDGRENPDHSDENPGHSDENPDHSDDNPDHSDEDPDHSDENPDDNDPSADDGNSQNGSGNQNNNSAYEDEPLIDIGENYYKPAKETDIVFDESTGIRYVKNQLLVSCYLGYSRDEVEPIFDEVGAVVVGYIELTGDYQIEFVEDKTIDELDAIAEYLYGYPYVSFISLNTSAEISFD